MISNHTFIYSHICEIKFEEKSTFFFYIFTALAIEVIDSRCSYLLKENDICFTILMNKLYIFVRKEIYITFSIFCDFKIEWNMWLILIRGNNWICEKEQIWCYTSLRTSRSLHVETWMSWKYAREHEASEPRTLTHLPIWQSSFAHYARFHSMLARNYFSH